jgi:hypothetical protein
MKRRKREPKRARKRLRKTLVAEAVVGLLICTAGFALTQQLSVSTTTSGDGATTVGTYTVATLQYELDQDTPTLIATRDSPSTAAPRQPCTRRWVAAPGAAPAST